ncbi:MAG: CDP-alcohol phosphatidyltransferase family protein [Lachnospiraceae bacterium]|nr:CDP-alcohol phosphatidyltransferase family protein [Lachnospiraceae bacterium]
MKKTMSAPAQSRTNTRIPSLIGVYDYTVVLTYAGMLAAFLGILMLMDRRFDQAVFCLMAAGICDMFDGAVAATKDRSPAEKAFGIQIDSLSDLISFGVLPALFVYRLSEGSRTAGLLAALYVLCALIRLAWFNTAETERQAAECGRRRSYLGLPVTTIAVLLPLLYLAYHLAWVRTRAAFPALLLLTGTAFLLPFRVKKPGLPGKIGLVVVGVVEAAGLFFFLGGDLI